MAGKHEPTRQEMDTWIHHVEHAIWRKTNRPLPEHQMASECWSAYCGYPPLWALALADAGEPGVSWCPQLVPELAQRTDTVEDELAALLA